MRSVGVVGAKLIYPDRSLNHTGIVVGPHGGLADTPYARVPEREAPLAWHAMAREVSAVTGACLMTRTDLYRRLGGFDGAELGVAYNDVDYCLRVRAAGQRVLYTPQAKLMHWGSATRGVTFDAAEHIPAVTVAGCARITRAAIQSNSSRNAKPRTRRTRRPSGPSASKNFRAASSGGSVCRTAGSICTSDARTPRHMEMKISAKIAMMK